MSLLKNSTVLVAEDDHDSRDVLCEFLRLEGYHVIEAADGESALGQLAGELPDAIILDLRMPKVDGWEVLAQLQQRAELKDIPVLIATAEVNAPKGFVVLLKPLSLNAVAEWLRRVLVSTESKDRAH